MNRKFETLPVDEIDGISFDHPVKAVTDERQEMKNYLKMALNEIAPIILR